VTSKPIATARSTGAAGSVRRWTYAASAAALAIAVLLAIAGEVFAQKKDPPSIPHGKSQLKGQSKEAPAKEQAKPPIPSPEQLAMMIQTSVVALSQANLTGNFTVLHALGAPSFQQSNPPQKLAEIFKNFREQNIDLTPLILFSPVLLREPTITDQGTLHLVGYYKTQPQQVHFELLFQPVGGQWRLLGISLRAQPAAAAANQPAAGGKQPPAAASAPDKSKTK
jgi:hypothetical protein